MVARRHQVEIPCGVEPAPGLSIRAAKRIHDTSPDDRGHLVVVYHRGRIAATQVGPADCSVQLCAQAVSSTASANAGDGVIHPGVCRGLVLSERGDGVELSLGCVARGLKIAAGTEEVLICWCLFPRCQGLLGLQKQIWTPVSTVKRTCSAISLPWSHVMERRSWAGRVKMRLVMALRTASAPWPLGSLSKHDEAAVALDEGADGRHLLAEDQVALPVARHGPVLPRTGAARSAVELSGASLTVGDRSAQGEAFGKPRCLARRFTVQPQACPRSSVRSCSQRRVHICTLLIDDIAVSPIRHVLHAMTARGHSTYGVRGRVAQSGVALGRQMIGLLRGWLQGSNGED